MTTLSPDEITTFAPKSTADLLKSIPGVWVESSGGVSGANVDVRGLPGGGDAPFFTLAINGSPVYGTQTLSFFEQTTIFRIDDTIASVEGLRGGPNAIFGNGEVGLTANFNLKEGGPDTESSLKYTVSDFGLQRVDAVLSGEVIEDLYYMVGGYFSSADGIRDTQFTSEEGYQFTFNLTRRLENGKMNLYARVTDDHGQWIVPQSLNTGNDAGTFTPLGNATRFRELQTNAAGDTRIFDFANGRGWSGLVAGGSFEYDLGFNFTIRDKFTVTLGNANTFGFVPAGAAVPVTALSEVIGGPVMTAGGQTLGNDQFVQTYGHWVVEKEIKSIINDLSINWKYGGHDVTVGYYQATWSADDFWLLGNPTPVHNVANGDRLDPGIAPADIEAAGGGAGFSFGLQSAGDARSDAIYIADSWQILDDLRLDAGLRHEWLNLDYIVDTGPGFADGTVDVQADITAREFGWTAAVNYDFTKKLGAFARYSDGFQFPHFDDIREGNQNVDRVRQVEGGGKLTAGWLDLYATVFFNTNDAFSAVVGGPVPAESFQTRAIGAEINGSLRFVGFGLDVNTTIQDAEITDSTEDENVGNRVLRQPVWQARLAPSYNLHVGEVEITAYGALTLIGNRFNSNANAVELGGYEKIDLGVLLKTSSGLVFQVHADNLNDSDGVTEGDPRSQTAPNGRPILGRSIRFSVGVNSVWDFLTRTFDS